MKIEKGEVYKHYNGAKYIVLDIAYMENNQEEMIVYTEWPVKDEHYMAWIRPPHEFIEKFKPV